MRSGPSAISSRGRKLKTLDVGKEVFSRILQTILQQDITVWRGETVYLPLPLHFAALLSPKKEINTSEPPKANKRDPSVRNAPNYPAFTLLLI